MKKLTPNWHPCIYVQDKRLYLIDHDLSFRILKGYIHTPLVEHCLVRNRIKDAPAVDFKALPDVSEGEREILRFMQGCVADIFTPKSKSLTVTKDDEKIEIRKGNQGDEPVEVVLCIGNHALPVRFATWAAFLKKGYCVIQGEQATLSDYGACVWFYQVFLPENDHT